MKIHYDEEADAAYIYLVPEINSCESKFQSPLTDIPGSTSQYIFDFDADGKLLGIEIIFASEILRSSTLSFAEKI